MEQTWEINGLSLLLDMEDYETNKRYTEAFKQMEKEEKSLQKNGNNSDFIKRYCLLFYNLYDNIFGEGTGEKLLEGKYNSRICDEVYIDFLGFVKNQQTEARERRKQIISKYVPAKTRKAEK